MMTFGDFFTETRKRWHLALKLLKKSRRKQIERSKQNQVSPIMTSRVYSGTIDASEEITIETYCRCDTTRHERTSTISYENGSFCYDSAYDTDQSSLTSNTNVNKVQYASVTYFNTKDNDETSSINTETTWIDCELETPECYQNVINEKIELMTSL